MIQPLNVSLTMNLKVGRVTPCAPGTVSSNGGAQGTDAPYQHWDRGFNARIWVRDILSPNPALVAADVRRRTTLQLRGIRLLTSAATVRGGRANTETSIADP